MDLNSAIVQAGEAVASTPANMRSRRFYATVPSLVVEQAGQYGTMTVSQWRECQVKPTVVLVVGAANTFGG